MHKSFIKIAAILGVLSVALGAFAAHSLEKEISDYAVSIFQTGVRYHLEREISRPSLDYWPLNWGKHVQRRQVRPETNFQVHCKPLSR